MTLRDQIGRLFIIGFTGTELTPGSTLARDIAERNLGGVILFSRCLHDRAQPGNITAPGQLRRLTDALQSLAPQPLLISVDQEGGTVRRLSPANGFAETPSARRLGAAGADTGGTREAADLTARILSENGVNLNFAPVVDVDANPDNPIIGRLGRSFSADPKIVACHAAVWIETHRSHGVLSCLKHFPGHGSSASDSHLGFVDISSSWREIELAPYRELIENRQADMIMTGHLFNRHLDPRYPATLSSSTISGLLRDSLGYDGVVVSDDLQMKAITSHYDFSEALCRCFASGVDMVVIGNNLSYNPDILEDGIKAVIRGLDAGLVSEKRLYSALGRVERLLHKLDGRT